MLPTWWLQVLGDTEERKYRERFSLFCGEEWFHQLTLLDVTSSSFSEKGKVFFFAGTIIMKTGLEGL